VGVKWARSGIDHPPPSSAEIKEIVELLFYSISGPARSVLELNLPLFHHFTHREADTVPIK